MTALDVVIVIAGSGVVGVLGGLLGVGGGVFLVPFLVFAGVCGPKEAVAISLCCVVGTSAAASKVSAASGLARLDVSLSLEPALAIGAVLASAVLGKAEDGAVLVGFAALMAVIVALMLYRRRRGTKPGDDAEPSTARVVAVVCAAFCSGAASGFFGVGGGVLVVPALVIILRLPLKVAAATSSMCLMTSAACGAAVHFANGLLRPDIVAAAIVGVLPGGFLGARLQRRVPDTVLEALFVLLAVVVIGLSLFRGLR